MPTVTLYGPRVQVFGRHGGPVRLLCSSFDDKTCESSIVTVELSIARGREWTLLMRGWLKTPGRDTLTFVTTGKDANRRDRECKVEITFPREQVRDVLPSLERVLDEIAAN